MLLLDWAWGTPMTMLSQTPFCGHSALFSPPMPDPSSSQTPAMVMLPHFTQIWRGPSSWGHWPCGIYYLCPAGEAATWDLPLFSHLLLHRGISASSAGSPTVVIKTPSSSVGSSAASSSLASCEMRGTPNSSTGYLSPPEEWEPAGFPPG